MAQKIALLVLGDALIAVVAVYIAFWVGTTNATPGVASLCLFVSFALFPSYFLELYNQNRVFRIDVKETAALVLLSLVFTFLALSSAFFMLPVLDIGRRSLGWFLITFGVGQFGWHCLFKYLVRSGGLAQNVLVLGNGDLARKMEQIMFLHRTHYAFSGYFDIPSNGTAETAQPNKETCESLSIFAKENKIDKLVVALTERRGTFPLQDLLSCKFDGIEIVDAPSFYEEVMGKMLIENITPGWFIFADGFKLSRSVKLIKRLLDIVLASMGLLVSSPLFPIIALLIKINSDGPVFYRQMRVGESGKNFWLIKFRTMKQDAESKTGAVWAQKNDNRITKVGSVLRKTRLDELPQFINVLKGEMSFIGPRPERPEFVENLTKIIPYYANRHFVKPGITGWAQTRYRYGASKEDSLEKLRYDLYYIKNLNPLLDMAILIDTVKVVLFGKGAR
ncbi:MAG TPA: TIGR03013 family XrtA/PEP-CTERM system glycosyltransferase [Dissulfurispiraceae bacterium]|nr:TIGR03013 family XrtA/PEP-CTERM system glycosyltransferase [Dissulfurispiraceae bacterium]